MLEKRSTCIALFDNRADRSNTLKLLRTCRFLEDQRGPWIMSMPAEGMIYWNLVKTNVRATSAKSVPALSEPAGNRVAFLLQPTGRQR